MTARDGNDAESVFKALADGGRREILRLLRGGEASAGTLARRLELTPATTSHPLGLLRKAGLVRVRRDGQQRLYALNTSVVEDVLLRVSELLQKQENTDP
ncbi:MAG: metalloregulator ArsR/SmtB family transcription factor [Gammaproteobacteria bacterium]